MTYDFRCEKCGKMIKLKTDPGRRYRCRNCRGWTRVSPLLSELPHPHVPLGAARGKPGDVEDDPEADHAGRAIAVQQEPEHADAVALSAVGSAMPFIFSAILHVGVFMIMVFIWILVSRPVTDIPGPDMSIHTIPTPDRFDFRQPGGGDRKPASRAKVSRPHDRPTEEIVLGPTAESVALDRVTDGKAVAGDALWGGRGMGLGFYGIGPDSGYGGAQNIVYVVDRSGSMAKAFTEVKIEMGRSIAKLGGAQRFHVILFGDGETHEGPRRQLVPATLESKWAAWEFLKEKNAYGATTALVALKRAFAVLARRPAHEKNLIYLLSDGDFSGILGGSEYRAKDGGVLRGNEAVLQWLADHNRGPRGPKVHVCTILLHSADNTAATVLKQIAEQNAGRFKYISPDE